MTNGLPPIKGYLPSSLIEWEGRISCVVFLPGCNFRCPFCHAAALVVAADKTETIPFESVAARLRANEGWIDGAVVSGGEPTLHKNLRDLILALRELVPAIKLDTNGSNPAVVEALLAEGLVDFVAMDIKAPLGEGYSRAAGVPVDCGAITASIRLLRECGVAHEFRTTVVPCLHTAADIVAIAQLLGSGERLVLQQFAPLNCLDGRYNDLTPYGRDELRGMARAARGFLDDCVLRGERSNGGETPSDVGTEAGLAAGPSSPCEGDEPGEPGRDREPDGPDEARGGAS